jgi:uncharacterized lipoprotein YmbA
MIRARAPYAAVLGLVLLAGCALLSGPTHEPTRFYMLTATASVPGTSPLRLGLGPVHFPGYLDRPEMAVRVDENRVRYNETARWAEPLKDNFEHVLASDLSSLLGTDRIIRFPWYRNAAINYSVSLDVSRCELQPDNQVALVARWSVRDGKTGNSLLADLADLRQPATTPDQAASALSALVAQLAQQIADAVDKQPAAK